MSLKQVLEILTAGEKLLRAASAATSAEQLAKIQKMLGAARGGLEKRVQQIEAIGGGGGASKPNRVERQVLTALAQYTTICRPRKQSGDGADKTISRLVEAVTGDPWLSSAPVSECVARLKSATGREKSMQSTNDVATPVNHDAIAKDFKKRAQDSASIKEEIDRLLRLPGLLAADEKRIAALITKAPVRLLGTKKARREALERWYYGRIREEARAEQHLDVIKNL